MSETSSNGVVAYDVVDRIALVRFNRPDKRNAMSPTLNRDMMEVLDLLEFRDDVGVLDLHVWQIGPGQHAAIVALSAARPASPAAYKARLTGVSGLAHVNVEVHAA